MLIEATSLTKDFPRARKGSRVFTAVAPLDLALEAGQLTVITGHSGSGKSTLLSMLAGMLPPTAGTVRLGEADLYAMRDEERSRLRNERIGLIPQGHTALRSLSVLENVLLSSVLSRRGRAPRNSWVPWVYPIWRTHAPMSCPAASCAVSLWPARSS